MSDNPSDEQRWVPSNEELPGAKITPPSGIPGTDEGQTDWGAPEAPGQRASHSQGGQPSSGKAVASLVLGIVGLVFCPVVGSILALVFGYSARKEIDNSNGQLGSRGFAVAGIILGWVGIVLFVGLIVVGFIAAEFS